MSIDPSSISLPSPRASLSPSPAAASPDAGPSRKRLRTEASPEDRKEARAHRNRIAAQNSRDKRKAQFSFLERRVAELEEENRQLRAGLAVPLPLPVEDRTARDRENEELRDRIRTLEKGWDAVVKALAAQGLPTGLPTPQSSSPSSVSDTPPSPTQSTTAFPVLVPPPSTAFPVSPSPSHSSLSSSSIFDEFEFESTRHLARVATTEVPSSVSLQRVVPQQQPVNQLSTSALLPLQTLIPNQHPRPRSLTTWQWKRSSAKSSRRLPRSHLRLFLRKQIPLSSPLPRRWPPPRRQ